MEVSQLDSIKILPGDFNRGIFEIAGGADFRISL